MADGALRSILASFGIEFEGKQLEKGHGLVNGMIEKLGKFGPALATAFGGYELISFGREILEDADRLAKQAAALGVSTVALQGWQHAAQLSGSSAEEFGSAFTKFNKNFTDAQAGTGPAADALKKLGITADDIKGKLPIDALDQVAEGFKNLENPGERVQAVMELFGKSGARLLPLLQEGAAGTKKLRDEVTDLGFAYDDAFLADAQEVNDNVDRLKGGIKGLAIQGIKAVLPGITEFTKRAVEFIKIGSQWIKQSSAIKTALVALGIGGAIALAPLLLSIAPIVAGFLALEDLFTFLSGGDSLIGRAIDGAFGAGSQEKIQAFVASIKDSGIADALQLFKGAFAIFTDGQPLSVKFKELLDFIDGTMRPQLEKDFGAVGAQIAIWTELLTGTLGVLTKIIGAFVEVTKFVGKGIGNVVLASDDVQAVDRRRRNDAATGAAADPEAWKSTFHGRLSQTAEDTRKGPGFFDSIGNLFKADAAPAIAPGPVASPMLAQSVATAPANANQPPIQQENKTVINQYFDTSKPADVANDAAGGAKAGLGKALDQGNKLLSAQGAIRKQG